MSEIKKVLTTVEYDKNKMKRLEDTLKPAEFIHLKSDDKSGIELALETADVAILKGDLDSRFYNAPHMKWIHCDHAGLNKSATPDLFQTDILVTSSAGRSAPVLAEHALFFMLALSYSFPRFIEAQKKHVWGFSGMENLRGLYGRTVGILGLGNNGCDLALKVKACGMKVLGLDLSTEDVPGVDQVLSVLDRSDFEFILSESDFLVITLPLTDKTFHLISMKEMKLMKNSAFIINIGRGAVINEADLIVALDYKIIAGAGLDTFEEEPLPETAPIWDASNALITPHVTPQVPDRSGRSLDIICENIRHYINDEPMKNLLRKEYLFSGTIK